MLTIVLTDLGNAIGVTLNEKETLFFSESLPLSIETSRQSKHSLKSSPLRIKKKVQTYKVPYEKCDICEGKQNTLPSDIKRELNNGKMYNSSKSVG